MLAGAYIAIALWVVPFSGAGNVAVSALVTGAVLVVLGADAAAAMWANNPVVGAVTVLVGTGMASLGMRTRSS